VISSFPEYVIDIETDGVNPRTNALSWVGLGTYGEVFLIPMQHRRGRLVREERLTRLGKPSKARNPPVHKRFFADPGEQLMPDVVTAAIKPLLFNTEQTKIGHNVKFDMLSLSKYYGGKIPNGPFNDTLVMQHVVDENRRSYSLKDIVPDFLRVPKDERKFFYPNLGKNIASHPIDAVARYLAKDIRYCWLLWQALCSWIDRESMWDILRLEMDLYPVIMRMEAAGAFVDPEHLDEMEVALDEEIQTIERDAWTAAKVRTPFPLTNTNMKRDLLFKPRSEGGQGLKPLKFTPKQNIPVLDQATLEHYAGRNKLAALFLDYSEKQKLLGTYVLGLRARLHEGKIHTSFTQHATVTGRLSSRDPNLQNIPRDSNVRALFVAPPGYSLVVADYDQIELRVTAHFSRDERMRAIFDAGEDIHAGTIAAITGREIGDISKEERQVGKGLNFAVVYGAGPQKVAAMGGVSVEEARYFMKRYYQRFSNIEPWKNYVLNQARRRGDRHHPYLNPPYVTTLLGRKRRLPDLFSYDRESVGRAERQAVNHIVQGTAAEIMKIGMIRVDKAFQGSPFTMVLTVHDEIISLCPEGLEDECQELVVSSLNGITLNERPIVDVPLVVSCGTAKRWSEAK